MNDNMIAAKYDGRAECLCEDDEENPVRKEL